MVVFTCNNCGDSLQKPRVAKHYQFQCKKRVSLSCVDCFKDFLDDEYIAHTKCITEAERYGGKNFVAKPSANKGERKQQEWIKIINDVLTWSNLSKDETNFLKTISKHDNVPRKKAKFLNFVKNAMGYRVNINVVESCWSKIETAFKENLNFNSNDSDAVIGDKLLQNDKNLNNEKYEIISTDLPKNFVENNNDKKRKLEVNREAEKIELIIETKDKSKKSKKIKLENNNIEEKEIINENQDKLVWRNKIFEILGDRNEISLKKLRKKLLNKYLSYYSDNEEKFDKKLMKKLDKIKELKLEDNKIKRI